MGPQEKTKRAMSIMAAGMYDLFIVYRSYHQCVFYLPAEKSHRITRLLAQVKKTKKRYGDTRAGEFGEFGGHY